ncbi:hypothetical protein [Haloferula sp. BvORR071]|uniref:hypothetical protein n=1 Tax=Haloferula sp. BvORR071 TaxID=1396141 RepID=UPI00224103C7|nr:hypothetical protein [Haloferula sp. BvORR071]
MTSELPGHLERAIGLELPRVMLQDLAAVVVACAIPATVVFLGWRNGHPIGRLDLLSKCAGAFLLGVVATVAMQAGGAVFALAGLIAWIYNAWWILRSLGRRLKDANFPAWAACLMGAAGLTGFPYLIALFLPSKLLKESKPEPATPDPKPDKIMRHKDYAVAIPEGKEVEGGYVRMEHGTPYSIRLENKSSRRCNARIEIEGNPVGTFRIDQRSHIVLERPSHDTGRFTFFKAGTVEAGQAGIVKNEAIGLVSVTFVPEMDALYAAPLNDEAGGTGLTGHSSQRFEAAEDMKIDERDAFTIYLRLVAKAPAVRPLVARSTPVPPPIGM